MLTLVAVLVAAHFLLTSYRAEQRLRRRALGGALPGQLPLRRRGHRLPARRGAAVAAAALLVARGRGAVLRPLAAAGAGGRPSRAGAGCGQLFVLLTVLTAASVLWSVRQTASADHRLLLAVDPGLGARDRRTAGALRPGAAPVARVARSRAGRCRPARRVGVRRSYNRPHAFPGSAARLPVLGTAAVVAAGTVADRGGRAGAAASALPVARPALVLVVPVALADPVIAAGYVGHTLTLARTSRWSASRCGLLRHLPTGRGPGTPLASPVSRTSNSLAFAAAAAAATVFVANLMTSVQLSADREVAAAAQQQVVASMRPRRRPPRRSSPSSAADRGRRLGAGEEAAGRASPRRSQLDKAGSPANYDGCLVYYAKVPHRRAVTVTPTAEAGRRPLR